MMATLLFPEWPFSVMLTAGRRPPPSRSTIVRGTSRPRMGSGGSTRERNLTTFWIRCPGPRPLAMGVFPEGPLWQKEREEKRTGRRTRRRKEHQRKAAADGCDDRVVLHWRQVTHDCGADLQRLAKRPEPCGIAQPRLHLADEERTEDRRTDRPTEGAEQVRRTHRRADIAARDRVLDRQNHHLADHAETEAEGGHERADDQHRSLGVNQCEAGERGG